MRNLLISGIGVLTGAFFCIQGCTQADKQSFPEGSAGPTAAILSESKKLTVASTAFLAAEKAKGGMTQAHPTIEFAKSGRGVAYIEQIEGKGRAVHNGKPGKLYQLVGDLTLSNDGTRLAYVAHHNEKMRKIVSDGVEGPLFLDIGMPRFSPDGKHLFYTVSEGSKNRLVIDHKVQYGYNISQSFLLSSDSRFLAFAATSHTEGQKQFVISDYTLQDKKVFDSCGDWFTPSADETRVAVVCTEGAARSIKIIDVKSRSVIDTLQAPAEGNIIRKRFSADNRSFLYTVMTDDYQRFLHYNRRVEQMPSGDEFMDDPLLLSNPERVGVIIGTAVKVRFQTAFNKTSQNEKYYGYISDFVSSLDGSHHAYVAINAGGEERMRVVVDGHEGPLFDKIVSPLFSPDGRLLVYRARQDGKRFLVVSDLRGKVLRQQNNYDMVFQPVFTADGKSVAYGVLDGTELWWKVEKL